MTLASEPQPAPTSDRSSAAVLPEVLAEPETGPIHADLRERAKAGVRKYGVPLLTHNGRDALVDAYQEVLDAVMYLKQAQLETGGGDSVTRMVRASRTDHLFDAAVTLARQLRTLIDEHQISSNSTESNRTVNPPRLDLFVKGHFSSHSGLTLPWKIECDSLTDGDIETLASIISDRFSFGSVHGIPNGGIRLATALSHHVSKGPRLIVDDVLTTGQSMEAARESPDDIGVVIFSRNMLTPAWITPLFKFGLSRVLSE